MIATVPGMVELAVRFFRRTRKDVVTQGELLTYVSRKTGYSHESVRGTIIGDACGRKLFGQPSFQHHWLVCIRTEGKPKRFVRRGTEGPDDVEATIDYNTPAKSKSRERGLKRLRPGPQKVITLASKDGLCVQSILRRCPEAEITNVEQNPKVLAAWQEKGIPTHDRRMTLHKFLHSEEFASNQYSLLNADLMGYASEDLHADLVRVNTLGNVKIIVLTLIGNKQFRNHGWWKDWAEAVFRSNDPTREWLVDIMDRYVMIDEWYYDRDPAKHSRGMRMFVLRRRK